MNLLKKYVTLFSIGMLGLAAHAQEQKLLTTQTPAQVNVRDGSVNYELGMAFTSTAAGQIKAIRFYKASKETGKHTGRIFSAGGQQLASVTFANETASGWQQASLSTPLNISANTRYTVSVNTGNAYYVATNDGLAAQVASANLRSVVGNNGVFGQVIGARPTSSWKNSNYFRDVVFVAASAPTNPPPVEPPPVTPPPTNPPPASGSLIPMSYDDPRFAANTTAPSNMQIPSGGVVQNRSWNENNSGSSVGGGDFTLRNSRIRSNEAIRIWGSAGRGGVLIEGVYAETQGTPGDHADTVQCYDPGQSNNITIRNSMLKSHNSDATAGFFMADDFGGSLTLENVIFAGGPFGLRMHADGNNIMLSLKDVYFVGPFGYSEMLLDSNLGGKINIVKWENVRMATIVNGQLVPGALIPKP